MGESEHVEIDEETDDDWEYVDDPAQLLTLVDEKAFARMVHESVEVEAPRRFALVKEIGERKDAEIIAWGMAFNDGAEVVGTTRHCIQVSSSSAERARQLISWREKAEIKLFWIDGPRPDQRPSRIPPKYRPCRGGRFWRLLTRIVPERWNFYPRIVEKAFSKQL